MKTNPEQATIGKSAFDVRRRTLLLTRGTTSEAQARRWKAAENQVNAMGTQDDPDANGQVNSGT